MKDKIHEDCSSHAINQTTGRSRPAAENEEFEEEQKALEVDGWRHWRNGRHAGMGGAEAPPANDPASEPAISSYLQQR